MPGAVTVGQLIVNLSANTADLKSDLAGSTASVKQAAQDMTSAWAGVSASTSNANAQGRAIIATLKEQIATFGMSDQQLIQYKADLAGVGSEVQALNARLQVMKDAAAAYGEEAKKAGGHTEQFSMATAGARRELIVLAHEMSQGNYSRFGGSLLVLAERTNAASLLFSSMGLALGALAAVVGLTGYELFKMHSEIDDFNKSIQLTGNFAGVTRDSLNSMAASIESAATGGVHKATEVLDGLAATGHFTAGAMLATGKTALEFARLTGQSSEDVVKFFDGMSNGVTAWAENANKSYHFLNAAQYEHIATLEKEGHSQQAVIEAMTLMNASLDENVKHLSYWQKNAQGWRMLLDDISESMRKMAFPTVDEQVTKEITKLNDLQSKMRRMTAAGTADSAVGESVRADIAKQRQVVHDLIAQSNKAELDAAAKQERDLANQRAIAAQKELDQIKVGLKTREELRAEAEAKIRKDAEIVNANAVANGKKIVETADDVARLVAASNAKYADKAVDDRSAQLNAALEVEKANFQEQGTLYNERIKQLDLYHSKFGMSDAQFYAGREAARAEYMQAAAGSYEKESDLVASFANRNSKEEADSNRTLQKMWADYQKFVADINGVAGLDSANVLANEQKAYDEMIAALDKAGQSSLKTLDDQIAKEQKHALEIGHTKAQIDLLMQAQQDAATADLQNQAQAIEDLLKEQDLNVVARGIYEEQLTQIKAQIEARKQLAGILNSNAALQADADAAKAASDAWYRANSRIGNDLASAIVDGGGRGVKRLIRDMELAFAKAVLQPILAPISGGIASILNPGAPQAGGIGSAGGASGLGSTIGAVSTANSLYKMVSGGFSGIGSAATEGAQSALNLLGPGTGFYSPAGSGLAASAPASFAGAVAANLAGIGIGHVAGNMIAGDYSIGSHGQAVTNVSAIIGSILGGPIGGAIGGAVGGLLNRAFGMGPTKVTSDTLAGTLSDSGATGGRTVTTHQDGGWFRSDKNGSTTTALTTDMANTLTEGFASLKQVTAGFAKDLGASSAALDGMSKTFNIALTDDATKNQQAITDFFAGLGDEMAAKLVPTVAEFSKAGETASATLQRLSGEFQATTQAATMLGKSAEDMFGSAGIASAAAREKLLNFAGGAQALASQASNFAQNYLTDAERLAPVAKALDAAMASLGLSGITTRDQFKAVVQGLDATTDAGAKELASLLALSDAFAQVHPAIEAVTIATKSATDVLNERTNLQDQLDQLTMTSAQLLNKQRNALDESNRSLFDQVQAAKAASEAQTAAASAEQAAAAAIAQARQTAADATASLGNSLVASMNAATAAAAAFRALNGELATGAQSTLSPEAKYAAAKQQYLSASGTGLQSAEQAFLTASKAANGNSFKYAADFADVYSRNAREAAAQDAVPGNIIAFWRSITAGGGIDGSHAGGLDYVPFNGYRAELHQGEGILTAAQNKAYRSGDNTAIKENTVVLRQVLSAIQENTKHTRKTADIWQRVTRDGNSLLTTAA